MSKCNLEMSSLIYIQMMVGIHKLLCIIWNASIGVEYVLHSDTITTSLHDGCVKLFQTNAKTTPATSRRKYFPLLNCTLRLWGSVR